uniref:Uncharacterized protein n=1 Tax=Romanomermis culicivorax TaxID=13658 RepID=A0A915HVL7_ROMCU
MISGVSESSISTILPVTLVKPKSFSSSLERDLSTMEGALLIKVTYVQIPIDNIIHLKIIGVHAHRTYQNFTDLENEGIYGPAKE